MPEGGSHWNMETLVEVLFTDECCCTGHNILIPRRQAVWTGDPLLQVFEFFEREIDA
jgi:hypothetical protein